MGVATSENLPELSADDVLILAVKPQDMQAACQNIRLNGALVLSVAAGLSIDTLSHYLGGTCRIVRIMPNTPAKIGLGVSGMFADAGVSEADRAAADGIMRSVGTTVWLNEEEQLPQYYRHQWQRPRLCFLSFGRAPKRGFGTRFQRTRRTRTEPRYI